MLAHSRLFLCLGVLLFCGGLAFAQPVLSGISPNTGPTAGGITVSIAGSNFEAVGSTQVLFGGVAATNVQVVSGGYSGQYVTCTLPAQAAGVVDVTVINPVGGSDTLTSGFTYSGPSISIISPSSGALSGGNPVTISGSSFTPTGVTSVTFGSAPATDVVVDSGGTSITCVSPANPAGSVTVTVTNPDLSTATIPFEYRSIGVSGIAPSTGSLSGGTSVQISGQGFAGEGSVEVTFGGVPATTSFVDGDATIYCTTPAASAGAVDVVVRNPNNDTATLPNGFTYAALGPNLSYVSPGTGPTAGGITATIFGSNFEAVGSTQVLFGVVAATNVQVVSGGYSGQYVTCTLPAQAAGVVDVTVINPDGGSTTLTSGFTYSGPSISIISPSSGALSGGNLVTISGSGFTPTGVTSITFGSAPATDVVVDSGGTSITCVSPANPAGSVTVTVTNPDLSTATIPFEYRSIGVSGIAPSTGSLSGGTSVQISGQGFAGEGSVEVTFGGVPATTSFVDGDATIYCTTPAASAGAVDVVVRNPNNDTATLPNGFTYAALGPNLSYVSPGTGPTAGGITATIFGSNFEAVGSTQVLFGVVAATNVQVVSGGYSGQYVTCTLPAQAAGVVDVTVINPDGGSTTLTSGFTYFGEDPGEGEGEGEGEPPVSTTSVTPSTVFPVELSPFELTAPAGSAYHWKKDGVYMSDAPPRITGTQSRALVFAYLVPEDAGVYTCEYNDGSKAIVETPPYVLVVLPEGSLPALSLWGMLLLAMALLTAARLIRRTRA